MSAALPLSRAASRGLQQLAAFAGMTPARDGEHRLLHLAPAADKTSPLPQATTLHLHYQDNHWTLVSLTNAGDLYDQHRTVEEICFDAGRNHYWQLHAGPLATASPALLEKTLMQLYRLQREGNAVIHTEAITPSS